MVDRSGTPVCTCRGRNAHSVHYDHLCLTITPVPMVGELTYPYGPRSCQPNSQHYFARDGGSHASCATSLGRAERGSSPDQYHVDGTPRHRKVGQIQRDARAQTCLVSHRSASHIIPSLEALEYYLQGSLSRALNFAGSTNTAGHVRASALLPRVRSE